MNYPCQIYETSQQSWVAKFPDLPIIFVQGATPMEVRELAQEMLINTLEFLLRNKKRVPLPSHCKLGQEAIFIPRGLEKRILNRVAQQESQRTG